MTAAPAAQTAEGGEPVFRLDGAAMRVPALDDARIMLLLVDEPANPFLIRDNGLEFLHRHGTC